MFSLFCFVTTPELLVYFTKLYFSKCRHSFPLWCMSLRHARWNILLQAFVVLLVCFSIQTTCFIFFHLMYVWPCIIYENDETYQLDATTMIYSHKQPLHVSDICMSIFRSFLYTGCLLLHVVFSTRCCGCGPTELVCSLVHYSHTVHKTTHRLRRTTAATPLAEHHMQQ